MHQKTQNPQRVLVTGSTGAMGQPLCNWLLERGHHVRGLARRPTPGLDDFVIGDLSDRDKVKEAVQGMDAVVHLAAYPNPADFIDVLLEPNVRGLYHICDASHEFGVKRLILASTLQVVSGHGYDTGTIKVEDGPAPTNFYALTKVWAEVMGEMYARTFGLSVISVRIGWLPRNIEEAQRLVSSKVGPTVFFSHNDSNRFFELCVESEKPAPGESAILFATSRPPGDIRLDLEPARQVIGYEPEDTWPEGLPFSIEGIELE